MPCQSERSAAPRRVRLTDQALVAVALARRLAGGAPSVVDLVAGLAAEPDGHAGRLLRERPTPAARLAERAAAAPPGLPALEVAAARAAPAAAPRTAGTADLLLAALETGGQDTTDLLAAAGYDARDVYRQSALLPVDPWADAAETVGFGSDADLAPDAGLAVARVRAAATGAVALVMAIAVLPAAGSTLEPTAEDLVDVVARTGGPDPEGDAGLDAVLTAARAWCAPPITAADLLRATLAAGGPAPAALLDAAGGARPGPLR